MNTNVIELHIAVAMSVIALFTSFIALMFGAIYMIKVRNIMTELKEVVLSMRKR